MNAKTAVAFEEIKKLLDAASQDADIPIEEFEDLVEATRDHCETVLDDLDDEEATEDEEEEEDELADDAVETKITDDGKVGGS